MRIRAFIFLAAVCSVSTGFAIQACGGDSVADPPATADSGPAETGPADTGPKDTGVDVFDAGPQCDPNVDITSGIPDAGLADGASTTGICLSCMKSKCDKETKTCAAECGCQKIAKDALDCYLKNSANPIACIGTLSGAGVSQKTQAAGLGLIGCINEDCNEECAVSALNPDAGDGG